MLSVPKPLNYSCPRVQSLGRLRVRLGGSTCTEHDSLPRGKSFPHKKDCVHTETKGKVSSLRRRGTAVRSVTNSSLAAFLAATKRHCGLGKGLKLFADLYGPIPGVPPNPASKDGKQHCTPLPHLNTQESSNTPETHQLRCGTLPELNYFEEEDYRSKRRLSGFALSSIKLAHIHRRHSTHLDAQVLSALTNCRTLTETDLPRISALESHKRVIKYTSI